MNNSLTVVKQSMDSILGISKEDFNKELEEIKETKGRGIENFDVPNDVISFSPLGIIQGQTRNTGKDKKLGYWYYEKEGDIVQTPKVKVLPIIFWKDRIMFSQNYQEPQILCRSFDSIRPSENYLIGGEKTLLCKDCPESKFKGNCHLSLCVLVFIIEEVQGNDVMVMLPYSMRFKMASYKIGQDWMFYLKAQGKHIFSFIWEFGETKMESGKIGEYYIPKAPKLIRIASDVELVFASQMNKLFNKRVLTTTDVGYSNPEIITEATAEIIQEPETEIIPF